MTLKPLNTLRLFLKDFSNFLDNKFFLKLKKSNITVIAGDTGCGKTTQIPQYILEENLNNDSVIAVT